MCALWHHRGPAATRPNSLHVLQPVHLRPPRNGPLSTPNAGHQRHTGYGRSGTIGGRQATEPPTRTCIQTSGTTTPATAPRSHSDPGAPGITCQEGNHAQPHEYGDSRHPTRATPRHGRPANDPRPGPHRRPSSTTPNTTRRVHAQTPASSPPASGDTGRPGAPPAPQPTSPADRGPHTRAIRRPYHTDMYRYPDRRHQHPQLHLEPQSPSSGDTKHVGPGVPSAGPGTGRASVSAAPRPASPTGSTAQGNAIWQLPRPEPGPKPGTDAGHRPS